MKRPLSGVRVLDFTHALAGPHCTLWLAGMGAEVIKIESARRTDLMRLSQPQPGEEASLNKNALFNVTNLQKQSCVIEISSPEGRETCLKLAAVCDVVVENFSPGILDRYGLSYSDFAAVRPDIIMASISGYGHSGGLAGFLAFASNIHAFAGLSSVTGYVGGPPEQPFTYYGDMVGGQAAVLGILEALSHRARTGEGQYIDAAMSEALIGIAPEAVLSHAFAGRAAVPRGNRDGVMVPHGCYPCLGKERWLTLAVASDDQWRAVAAVLGHPEWTADPRFLDVRLRRRHEDELDDLIAAHTRVQDAAELAERLQDAGIAAAPTQTPADLLRDPQLLAREFLVEVDQPEAGVARLPKLPWRLGGAEDFGYTPAPAFGSATETVLVELLQLDEAELERLRSGGAIG